MNEDDLIEIASLDDMFKIEVIEELTRDKIDKATRFTFSEYVSCDPPINKHITVVNTGASHYAYASNSSEKEMILDSDYECFKEYLAQFEIKKVFGDNHCCGMCGGDNWLEVEFEDGHVFSGSFYNDNEFLQARSSVRIERNQYVGLKELFTILLSPSMKEAYYNVTTSDEYNPQANILCSIDERQETTRSELDIDKIWTDLSFLI